MPRCLPWFSKNKNYTINKTAVKTRNTNTTSGLVIRKPSDYDKILNSQSAPKEEPVLPRRFQKLKNGIRSSENITEPEIQNNDKEVSNSDLVERNVDNVDNNNVPLAPDLDEHTITDNHLHNQEEEIISNAEEIILQNNAERERHHVEETIQNGLNELKCDNDNTEISADLPHYAASVESHEATAEGSPHLEDLQDDLEDDVFRSNIPRPTIVELKLQDDASSFVSGGTDFARVSDIFTDTDSEIVNSDEEAPEIFRRSGVRTDLIDINKNLVRYEKAANESDLITEALMKNEFLKNILTETTKKLIVDIMTPKDIRKGEIIILQGEPGDNLYVSESGDYQVIKDNVEVHTFNRNEVFGEVSVIYNHKRQATVKALTNGKVWKLHREDYYRIMVTSAIKQEEELITFLKTVPTIQDAPLSRIKQAVGLFNLTTFTAGTNIVTEGEEGNTFFIIKAGAAKVTKNSKMIATLSRGQFFGEQALLNNDKKRQATVIADTPVVECLVLPIAYFIDLFGDLTEFMTVPLSAESAEPVICNEYSNIELNTLKLRTTVGVGGFGRVELAHLIKDDKKTFALKYLKRTRIVENEQINHVFNEKTIQMQCSSPFIVQLYKTYNDRKYLYLLLELCLGGDIINLLQRQRLHCCKEEETKFLAACVLEALSYLHQRNFVFRDLKPENMMIDQRGYVKLTDFGFAKKLNHDERTYTFAGTPEYVAPEIIYQRGHDRAVDYWAFGIFIFELLVGRTPFKTQDPSYMQTYNLIVRGIQNVIFPTKVKGNATNIIMRLCNSKPSERLGYKRQGIQEIRDHKWFQGFNWEKLQSCRMTSPFVPKLGNHLDTRYFDRQIQDRDIPEDDFNIALDKF